MEGCNKFSICRACAGAPNSIIQTAETIETIRELIKKEIGPELADKAGLNENTGRESFINALNSGSTLQVQAKNLLGLDCLVPKFW